MAAVPTGQLGWLMGNKQSQSDLAPYSIVIESYGTRVRIDASDPTVMKDAEHAARRALVDRLKIVDAKNAEHSFGINVGEDGTLYLYQNGSQVSYDTSHRRFYKFFDSMLRIVVAEHAVGWVFIHAGVVGWKGRAIILPANSFRGKTTLVTALARAGADYYSDEYAVIDEAGLVHPFPRALSIRSTVDGTVKEESISIEDLGGKQGFSPIPVGLVALAEYTEDAVWNPETLSPGRGMIEVLPHTIPRNFNPAFSLKVLNTAISDAIILKSSRGDADETAIKLLSFFDNFLSMARIT